MITTLWNRADPAPRRVREDEDRPIVGPRDARVRIVSTLFLIAAVLATSHLTLLALLVVLASLCARATGLTFSDQQHRLIHVEGFMLALFILLPFTVPGEPSFQLGFLTASKPGIAKAATIALKVFATALIVFTLIGSLEPVRLGRALGVLGVPAKLVHLLLFAIRYIAVFRRETSRLHDAMRCRAFSPATNIHTLNAYANLIGMMLVRSLDRAERVDEAMRCRAFSGQFPLRSPKPLRLPDAIFAITTAAIAATIYALPRLN